MRQISRRLQNPLRFFFSLCLELAASAAREPPPPPPRRRLLGLLLLQLLLDARAPLPPKQQGEREGKEGKKKGGGPPRTPTLDGKLRMRLLRPSKALSRHASMLNSTIRDSPPASFRNLRDAKAVYGGSREEIGEEHQLTRRCARAACARRGGRDLPPRAGRVLRGVEEERAGNILKTTISMPSESAKHAQKIAMLRTVGGPSRIQG